MDVPFHCILSLSFNDLPSELIVCIFSFMDSAQSLRTLFQVSQLWRECGLEDSLWKPLYYQRWAHVSLPRDLPVPLHSADLADMDTSSEHSAPTSWFRSLKTRSSPSYLKFLILGSEMEDSRLQEVGTQLHDQGLPNVDIINVRESVPSYEALEPYDAILFFTYYQCKQDVLGDLLAQFVEHGGGVVVAAYSSCVLGNRLLGRWENMSYSTQAEGSNCRQKNLNMGQVYHPSHPIMRGVHKLNGGSQSNHGNGKLVPTAHILAEWENGQPLVSESRKCSGSVIGLNFYPPSSRSVPESWKSQTDGSRLLRNALYYATGAHGRPAL